LKLLTVSDVTKTYGSIKALQGVGVEINAPGIVGLVGPNGAGKTTLIKSILGLTNVNSGSIKLFGHDWKDVSLRKKIAYLPEKFNFYPYYTVQQTLAFFGAMRNLESSHIERDILKSLELLKITELLKRKLSTLSKGQLQRVGLASLIIGEADFFILDEPYSGVDPIGIRDVKNFIEHLKERSKTILISSHILVEIESLCEDVILIAEGQCLAQGKVAELIGTGTLEDFFCKLVEGGQNV
jgi:ABC-2 type transport system ATP-binding protein